MIPEEEIDEAQIAQKSAPEATALTGAAAGRELFRYITAQEWADYRAIMDVFANTFFSEFTPEEVAARLGSVGYVIDAGVVGDRLESLYKWGNLTISSVVGNPSSLQDYYRSRNRYLITPAGQEVHQLIEGVLRRVDTVTDVSITRLRMLLDALEHLASLDAERAEPDALADAGAAVFDPHEAFTAEITQLFAAINQWQTRYDLTAEELRFFADVLVGYIDERLAEIERTARPIGQRLAALSGRFAVLVERASRGLAGRVDEAGLAASVAVRRRAGSRIEDWEHLCSWFLPGGAGRPSRIQTLTREAIAAVRTLTLNLTRLSRAGAGSASRRGDFLRLAQFLDRASAEDSHRLVAAAFGLAPANHYGVASADSEDPVAVSTSWWTAPRAEIALAMRERAEASPRGRSSPIPDRTQQRRMIEQRRDQERRTRERAEYELLDATNLDGRALSEVALKRLQEMVSRTLLKLGTQGVIAESVDGALRCRVERTPGRNTAVHVERSGTLTFLNLTVSIRHAPAASASEDAVETEAQGAGTPEELSSAL